MSVALGVPFVRALAATWRVREVGRDGWNRRRAEGRPSIIALWHGQLLALLSHHRDLGVAVLVSEHRDGEIIARVLDAFGYRTVRGSTSRGGGRALLELVRMVRRGDDVCITPDGPRGPRHTFAPGALIAAQRSGAPIVCVAAHVDRAWRLKSWDGFEIPKPFARITVAYGEPTQVVAERPRDAAERASEFESTMQALAVRATDVARARR
ncbi:MAG: lysophospholipid acyltransferase family protein [Gemmatirosa sp.]|nr:lysophospholipid acyltransferase family protein [Gemmatirosa sp.]